MSVPSYIFVALGPEGQVEACTVRYWLANWLLEHSLNDWTVVRCSNGPNISPAITYGRHGRVNLTWGADTFIKEFATLGR